MSYSTSREVEKEAQWTGSSGTETLNGPLGGFTPQMNTTLWLLQVQTEVLMEFS